MPISLASIITHYRKFKNANPDLWIQHCINQNTIKSAIYFAALSENQFGKRHKHQYRLESKNMILFKDRLLANHKMIQRAINFDNLLQIIAAQRIHGIGDLAVYDTAIRIGAFLGLSPRVIYLHAGTKIGAKRLLNRHLGNQINKNDLPPALANSNLNCYELEDLLCIYKDKF